MAITGTDVIKTSTQVSAPTEEPTVPIEEPTCSDKDVQTDQELDSELEETLQFVAGQLRKKKKRQVEDGLLRDGKKSTNPILPKARACKKL